MDSAEPIQNVKYFTDTLWSPCRQHWKEDVYEHHNESANVSLCSIPFSAKSLSPHAKICKPVLAPRIKIKDDMPNYYDLRVWLCKNGKEESTNKVNTSCLPASLVDYMRYNLDFSECFALWTLFAEIVNCFQSTIRDPKDKVCIFLSPCCLEWLNCSYFNAEVSLDKCRLVVQLLNVCQGHAKVGRL